MAHCDWGGHLFCKLEGVVGVQLGKGGSHVHFGQGLADAVAGPIAKGEPALALLAEVQPQVIHHLLAVSPLLLLTARVQPRLLGVLSPRLQAARHDGLSNRTAKDTAAYKFLSETQASRIAFHTGCVVDRTYVIGQAT